MPVWRIENGNHMGSVSYRSWFKPELDAEVLATGYNVGKRYDDISVGRHANWLYWGYTAPPADMTPSGQHLFLNAICYISKFDGRSP